jgi:hypothetical protein
MGIASSEVGDSKAGTYECDGEATRAGDGTRS